MMQPLSLATLALLAPAAAALSAAEWRTQSIYFLLTDRFGRADNSTTAPCDTSARLYCGGSWQGIVNHLDYIQGMGFTAVWISPVTGQFYQDTADGTSYHGYWQQDINTLNPHFGTADDLAALSAALHARGMLLMVDVVVNHMREAYDGPSSSVDFGVFAPFDAPAYFHPYCPVTDYSNQTNVEDCWLGDAVVSLPDLNTDLQAVQDLWYGWIRELVANYSIDGLRLDTAKHVQKSFWPGFRDAAGVFCVGEVFDGDPAYVCPYQAGGYLDGVLNYPVYYPLVAAFGSTTGDLAALAAAAAAVAAACADPTLLGTFAENHDTPRFASLTDDDSLARNVLAFVFLADGIPVVYAGQEQRFAGAADPANRAAVWLAGYPTDPAAAPLYAHIQATNRIRRLLAARAPDDWAAARSQTVYQDAHTLGWRKGGALAVLSNLGVAGPRYALPLLNTSTGLAGGAPLVELYTCAAVTADSSGGAAVPMAAGQPRVLVPASWVSGSGLCGEGEGGKNRQDGPNHGEL